jgi:hypothetical protein
VSTTEPDPGQGGAAPAPPPPPPSAAGPWASDDVARPAGPAPTDVEQPSSIRNAVRLMYVGAVLSVLGGLSIFLQVDAIRDQIEEDDPSLTGDEVDTAVAIFVVTFVVISLISIGLWLWMAYANGRGQSWARVVATVLGGLSIVSALVGIATGSGGVGIVFSILSVVLAAVILFLLYRPESSRFYEARSR